MPCLHYFTSNRQFLLAEEQRGRCIETQSLPRANLSWKRWQGPFGAKEFDLSLQFAICDPLGWSFQMQQLHLSRFGGPTRTDRGNEKKLHQPPNSNKPCFHDVHAQQNFIGRPIPEKRNERKEGRQAPEPEPGTRRSQKITMEHNPLPEKGKKRNVGKQDPEP